MEAPIQPQFATHQLHDPNLYQQPQSTLVSQPEIALDAFQFDPQLENQPELALQGRTAFNGVQGAFETRSQQQQQRQQQQPHQQQQQQPPRFHEIRPNAPISMSPNPAFGQGSPYSVLPRVSRPGDNDSSPGGQMFGVLTPHPQLPSPSRNHSEALGRLQNEIDLRPQRFSDGGTTEGHFKNLKMIPNPPNLEEWRAKLFDVDDTIMLTEDEYVQSSLTMNTAEGLSFQMTDRGTLPDSRPTSHMWTTSTHTARPKITSASLLFPTTGIAG